MARWIAFDDDTAEAVVCRYRRGAAEIRQGNAIDAVIQQPGTSVMLMPATMPDQLLVVTVVNSKPQKQASAPNSTPTPVVSRRWWAPPAE
jgi:hypothetical protein